MKEYILSLFALSVCCAIVELFAPAGEGDGIGRHIKLMCALCLLCVSISPLLQFLGTLNTLPERLGDWLSVRREEAEDIKQDWNDRWQKESERIDVLFAEQTVAQMLCEQFSMSIQECGVQLALEDNGERIAHIRVALSGQSIWKDTHAMEEYLKQTFGCESTIYIE